MTDVSETERPWPPNCYPTALEWLTWFTNLDDPEKRLEVAALVVHNAQLAGRCLAAGHEHAMEQIRHLPTRLEDIFHEGKRSERDRILRAVENEAHNGAGDPGQRFYDWGINPWLYDLVWAEDLAKVQEDVQ